MSCAVESDNNDMYLVAMWCWFREKLKANMFNCLYIYTHLFSSILIHAVWNWVCKTLRWNCTCIVYALAVQPNLHCSCSLQRIAVLFTVQDTIKCLGSHRVIVCCNCKCCWFVCIQNYFSVFFSGLPMYHTQETYFTGILLFWRKWWVCPSGHVLSGSNTSPSVNHSVPYVILFFPICGQGNT